MNVTQFSIRRPITTIMFFLSMVVIGLIAAIRLPLELLPEISFPAVFVELPYAGSTAQESERTILRPAEDALATMPGIKRLIGNAGAEGAFVGVFYSDWRTNVALAASEVRERLDAIRDELPDDLQRYYVGNWSSTDEPILQIRLSSRADLTRAYDLIDREIKRPIERVPGVARVRVSGAAPNEVEVALHPERLSAHGVGLNELTKRLQEANFSISAGHIEDSNLRMRVQPVGEINDLQQLRDMPINVTGLRLGDIAEVRLKPERMDYARRLEGSPAVGIDVYKERNANLVEVSRAVLVQIESFRTEPALDGLQIRIVQNQGEAVTSSLGELAHAGAVGLALSIVVLFFFLRHWPSTLMVTLAIPICFIMTLGFMYFFGITLNILSMMGLLLSIGMLVDNAVVVVESIYQERERMPDQPQLATIVGTRHVAIALSAGTLCHCIVFLPNIFGETTDISIFMTQIAITISVSLLASWLVAISLIPMLSARMKTPPAVHNKTGIIMRLQNRYAGFLRWTLEHRGWSLFGILAIVAISVVPITQVKTDMFGGGSDDRIDLDYQWNGSYTKDQMLVEVQKVEAYLASNRQRFGIQQVYSHYSEGGSDFDAGDASTRITLDRDQVGDIKQLAETITRELPKSARVRIHVGNQGGTGSGGEGEAVQVQLVGDSAVVLRELANDVIPMLARHRELRDVRVDQGNRSSELSVRVDRERAASFGFSSQEVAQFIGLTLRGGQLREFQRNGEKIPVWVRFSGADNYDVSDLTSFNVRSDDGRLVPLLSMVNVETTPAPNRIEHTNRRTTQTIVANLSSGTLLPDARKAMEETLQQIPFPAGYGYSFDGSGFVRDEDASQQMMVNLLIALIMVYVVMAAVFESLLFPAAIMSAVVFSIFGVYWLFWLTGDPLSLMALIGVLVLMGVVVNNGIVMVEHINNLRRRGMPRSDALVAGGRERLRPILMTMGTAILAMVPIALSTDTVDNMPPYYPMARAIAGGLAFSTVVSLLFLPTIYAVLDDLRNAAAFGVRRARGVETAQAPG